MADNFLPPDDVMNREKLADPEYVKREGERMRKATQEELNRQERERQKVQEGIEKAADLEKEKQMEALRAAQPSWRVDGHGIRGPGGTEIRRRTSNDVTGNLARRGSWERRVPEQSFSLPSEQANVEVTATVPLLVSFKLEDATTTEGDPPVVSNKVLVFDGRINGVFPDGMPSGNYIIDLEDPAASIIYAGVTFDPTTLAITDRFLAVWKPADGMFPESRVEDATHGFLYWPLGFTYFDGPMFKVWNQRLGDINFAFAYGQLNGRPALLPIDSTPGYIDLEALLT